MQRVLSYGSLYSRLGTQQTVMFRSSRRREKLSTHQAYSQLVPVLSVASPSPEHRNEPARRGVAAHHMGGLHEQNRFVGRLVEARSEGKLYAGRSALSGGESARCRCVDKGGLFPQGAIGAALLPKRSVPTY